MTTSEGRSLPSTSANDSAPEVSLQPSVAEIRGQVERILESSDFGASERLKDFLRFVVDATLGGDSATLKGYTIATRVFGRPRSFDPQVDPIVRVEAGRLRKRLEHYYLTAGADDAVIVEIPKGGYVPRFSYRAATPPGEPEILSAEPGDEDSGESSPVGHAEEPPSPPRSGRRGLTLLAALLGLIAVGSGLAWLAQRSDVDEPPGEQTLGTPTGTVRLLVLPFDYSTDTQPHPLLDEGMVSELIATLSTLPGTEVLAQSSGAEAASRGLTPEQLADGAGVDYVIRGIVRQHESQIRATVTVIDAKSSVVRSASTFEGTTEAVFDLQEEIARHVAGVLAIGADPVFERRVRATKKLDPEVVALHYEARTLGNPPTDPVRSRLAEEAYRRVIELDPEYAGGYVGLAYVLAFRSWWRVGEDPALEAELAMENARTALEKDPESASALATLAIASNVQGDHEAALLAAQRVAARPTVDPGALISAALVLTLEGEVEAAIPLARAAVRLDPLTPRTPYRNILGMSLFQAGRYEESIEALYENLELGGPDGPHTAYWRAGSLVGLGRMEDAREELEKAARFPGEFDMRDFLRGFRHAEDRDKLPALLEPLGFD